MKQGTERRERLETRRRVEDTALRERKRRERDRDIYSQIGRVSVDSTASAIVVPAAHIHTTNCDLDSFISNIR